MRQDERTSKQIDSDRKNNVGTTFKRNTIVGFNKENKKYTLMCDCGKTSTISCAVYENAPTHSCRDCSKDARSKTFTVTMQEVDSRDNTSNEQDMINSWLKTHDVKNVKTKE